jgi:hypothetical protein
LNPPSSELFNGIYSVAASQSIATFTEEFVLPIAVSIEAISKTSPVASGV